MPYTLSDTPDPHADYRTKKWVGVPWHGIAAALRLLELEPGSEFYEVLNSGGRLTFEQVAALVDLFERDSNPLFFAQVREFLAEVHAEQIPVWVHFHHGFGGVKGSHCLGHEDHPMLECVSPFDETWADALGKHSDPNDEHWRTMRVGAVGKGRGAAEEKGSAPG